MEAIARLRRIRISARKVGLLADLIRGKSVSTSLAILQNRPQNAAVYLRKLLLSAISNWNQHHTASMEKVSMVVKKITVDRAKIYKRTMPAPRGIGHKINRRTSHVTVVVGSLPAVVSVGKKEAAKQ